MKKIKCVALVAITITTLLAACGSDSVSQTVEQPPPPLAWDQGNWNEVLWQ